MIDQWEKVNEVSPKVNWLVVISSFNPIKIAWKGNAREEISGGTFLIPSIREQNRFKINSLVEQWNKN